jgi:hypothetical protein
MKLFFTILVISRSEHQAMLLKKIEGYKSPLLIDFKLKDFVQENLVRIKRII